MKIRIYFAILLLLTLFLAWVGEQFIRDPGYVLINYAGYVVETSVWLPIVLMVLGAGVAILLWEMVQRLLGTPSGFRRWWSGRSVKSVRHKTLLALIEFAKGDSADLIKLLPKIEKEKMIEINAFSELQALAYQRWFAGLAQSGVSSKKLLTAWEKIPKAVQQLPELQALQPPS